MAITGGYFNSVNGDRLYYADQVNNFFEGLVGSGVFESVDGALQVKAGTGMQVQVLAGKLTDSKGRWLRNDAVLNLTIEPADVTLPRYDAVIAAIDSSLEKRAPSIYIKKGAAANAPVKPAIERNSYLEEYCLAYVYVDKSVTSISQSAITDTRPNNILCGFVTGLIDQVDTSELFIQYQTAFNEWFNAVKDTFGATTLIRQYTSSYTTTGEQESVIPINISQYNKEIDILNVYINGMKLIQNVDYTKDSNTQITLTKSLCAGAKVEFEVFKSVDGSNAETVVQLVYQLQTILNKTKITADDGVPKLTVTDTSANVLDAFVGLGTGVHTINAANGVQGLPNSGAYKIFGQITSTAPANGYIIAMGVDGSVYANSIDKGVWRGWKSIYEATPPLLYHHTSNEEQPVGTKIIPTKPLSNCQHGWILTFAALFSGNIHVQTACIPKIAPNGANWDGEIMEISLTSTMATNTRFLNTVKFKIYNNKLVIAEYYDLPLTLQSIQEY